MLISPAYAQAAGGGGDSPFVTLLPLVLIFVVFYFLLIRPQQKKVKQHKGMVEALRRGDRVVTGGGMFATVTKVINDNEVQVELAENVKVRVVRQTIQEVLAKTEPAGGSGSGGGDGEGKTVNRPANDDKAKSGGLGGLLGGLLGGGKPNK